MDAATIIEINKQRLAMGMKPLPVPGQAPQAAATPEPDEEEGSTLEKREAASYENFKKLQDAERAKKKREEKAAAIKRAREKAERFKQLEGKGLADEDDTAGLDAKTWLKNQKKRQKEIAKQRQEEKEREAAEAAKKKEYTAKDLAGIKVAHDVSSFVDGDDQILTLKDTDVLDEEGSGDELENMDLREQEKLKEKLELKKKKPIYNPMDFDDDSADHGILSHYDEDENRKKNKKLFTLDVKGDGGEMSDILNAPAVQRRRAANIDVEMIDDVVEPTTTSDYLDISEIKVKKPKKKKSKSTRQRPADDEEALFPGEGSADQSMDVDTPAITYTKKRKTVDDDLNDDDDLQATLALTRRDALKKRKKMRPEDIAKQLREQPSEEPEEKPAGGIVLDEITGFVDTLRKSNPEEERKRPSRPRQEDQKPTAMDEESDEEMADNDTPEIKREESLDDGTHQPFTATGVEEEESVGQGMGATLKLLKDRGLVKDSHGAELNEQFVHKEKFLAELHRRMLQFDEEARQARERDRASGRLDRMSAREREAHQQHENARREKHQAKVLEELYKTHYKPTVDIKYFDDHGRKLDQKEAFKHLSHQFHGKGSGKGKTDKYLKKIEEERRREAMSMLDASQNVGMSSAHAQQLKKRREAGVRLA